MGKFGFLMFSTLFFFASSFGATPFPVKSKGEVVYLKKSESPYLLEENFVLAAKDTLRIEAGVTVQMGELAKMLLNGITEIEGTLNNPVRFVPEDSTESWNGVHFISSSAPFSVKYLILEKAFRNTISHAEGIFEGSQFIDNYYGIRVNSSPLVIFKDCSFERNRFALSATTSTIQVDNLSIRRNVFGLYLEGGVEFRGSKAGVVDNMEADIREGSVAGGKERVPLSVWQRVETAF